MQRLLKKFIWLEDIIKLVEGAGSSELYSVLKRVDEKYVTEHACQNPKFVEDVVREIAQRLLADDNITWFAVEAENFESIHNHSAYACIERDKVNNAEKGRLNKTFIKLVRVERIEIWRK